MGVMREEEGGTTACHKLDQDLGGMDFIATHTHTHTQGKGLHLEAGKEELEESLDLWFY